MHKKLNPSKIFSAFYSLVRGITGDYVYTAKFICLNLWAESNQTDKKTWEKKKKCNIGSSSKYVICNQNAWIKPWLSHINILKGKLAKNGNKRIKMIQVSEFILLYSVLDMTKLINFNNLSFSCLASYFCDVCSILLSLCLRLPKVGADRPRLMLTWKQIWYVWINKPKAKCLILWLSQSVIKFKHVCIVILHIM